MVKNFFSRISARELLIIILIFVLALGVRAHLMRFELYFEFDSYWHSRFTSYILQGDGVPASDPLAYYQLNGGIVPNGALAFWYSGAIIYKLFTLGAAYDKLLFIEFVKFIPAFWGALTSIMLFFLFREMYGLRAGILGGFFAAITPAFVYRSMAGFFEGSSMIFFFMLLGFFCVVKAIKNPVISKKSVLFAVLGALALGVTPWIGGWFLIIPYILFAFLVFALIGIWLLGFNFKKAIAFIVLFGIMLGFFSAMITVKDGNFGWTGGAFNYLKKFTPIGKALEQEKSSGTTAGDVLAGSVGEQSSGFQFFGHKYNALIIFPFLAIIFIPIRVFFKKEFFSLLVWIWIVATLLMAWSRLQMTYAFGLAVAASAGFVCFQLIEWVQNRNKTEKRLVGLFVFFFLVLGVGSAAHFMLQNTPNIELAYGWKDALAWMREQTPKDSKMLNWWDEGHWITFMGERKASTDNRNYDFNANSDMGLFVITEDENKAFEIMKKYDADYVVISVDLLEKQRSLGLYALITLDSNDPRIAKLFGLNFFCSKISDGYQCGPNKLSEQQMENVPAQWTGKPYLIEQGQVPLYVYRAKNNSQMFIASAQTNNTIALKLWVNDSSIRHFELAYDNPGVKIFKVKK